MSIAAVIVLVVVVVTVVFFVTEWIPFDVTALCAVAALLLTGVITPTEAFSGFSSPATLTIAAMLVLTAALERTGMLQALIRLIEWLARRSRVAALGGILIFAAVASAFVNNTAVVTLLIPVILRLSGRLEISASRLLMPLSFIAIFGGVCTLVGTSTNLLVSAIIEDHGLPPLTMFEMAPLGLVFLIAGFVYCVLVLPRLLPDHREASTLTERFRMDAYLTDLRLGPSIDAREPQSARELVGNLEADVLSVLRDDQPIGPTAELAPGDVLRVRAGPEAIRSLLAREEITVGSAALGDADVTIEEEVLVEAVLAPDAPAVGQRVGRVDLPGRFGAVVLAVRHHGRLHQEHFADIRLRGGDSLLLRMPPEAVNPLRASRAFLVLSEAALPSRRAWKAAVALLAMIGAVAVAALTSVPIVTTALAAVCLVLLCRCLNVDEMYKAVHWKVIVLLAGVIPIGVAMEKSGVAGMISHGAVALFADLGPHAAVGGVFVLTVLLTNVMSNVAAAALLVPVAFQAATGLAMDPRTLVMAVTFGASLSFLSPIGYQTNMLIYGPGHYRFADFIRVGTPLTIVCCVIAVIGIPWAWPP